MAAVNVRINLVDGRLRDRDLALLPLRLGIAIQF